MYDLTKGNYTIQRTISYVEQPASQLILEANVKASGNAEWVTEITVNGKYDGPTDFVSQRDYQVNWDTDGKIILESGSSTLITSAGKEVHCVWSSKISPRNNKVLNKFPANGEQVNISFSPFKIDGNSMSYTWDGTVMQKSQRLK